MFDTNGDRIGMMLNTDMELAYDIPVDSNLGTTSCAIFANSSMSACPDAKTKPQVQIYATVRVSPFFNPSVPNHLIFRTMNIFFAFLNV